MALRLMTKWHVDRANAGSWRPHEARHSDREQLCPSHSRHRLRMSRTAWKLLLTFGLYAAFSRKCFAYRDRRGFMLTIEITNPTEVRRCRYALYRGEKARLMLNGVPVTGMVHAVHEDRSSAPMRWIITMICKQPERAAPLKYSRPAAAGRVSGR